MTDNFISRSYQTHLDNYIPWPDIREVPRLNMDEEIPLEEESLASDDIALENQLADQIGFTLQSLLTRKDVGPLCMEEIIAITEPCLEAHAAWHQRYGGSTQHLSNLNTSVYRVHAINIMMAISLGPPVAYTRRGSSWVKQHMDFIVNCLSFPKV